MKRTVFLVVLWALLAMGASAQSMSVTTDLASGVSTAPTVNYLGMLHAIEGGSARYNVNFTQPSADVITSAQFTYTFDGNSVNKAVTPVEGKVSIDPVTVSNLAAGASSKSFKCSLSYVCKRQEKDTTIVVEAEGTPVMIHARPTYSISEPANYVFYSVASATWSIRAEGGGEWRQEWRTSDGGTSSSAYYSFSSSNTSTSKKTVTVTLKLTNYAPDGTTVWETVPEKKYTVDIYPKVSVKVSPDVNYAYTQKVLFQDQEWKLSVNASGGYSDGWTYVWKDDKGNVVGTGTSYIMSSERSKSNILKKVTVTAVNTGVETGGTSRVWYTSPSYTWYATFLPCPVVEITGGNGGTTDLLYNDSQTFGFTIKDDNGRSLLDDSSYNWQYEWSYNGSTTYSKTRTVTGNNSSTTSGVSRTLTLKVSGKLPETSESYVATREETIISWPTPSASRSSSLNSTIYACGGQSVPLKVDEYGGVKSGWRYYWYRNGNLEKTTSTDTYYADVVNNSTKDGSYVTDKFTVRAVNICRGIERYSEEFTSNIIIYPRPRYSDIITLYDVNRKTNVSTGIRLGNTMQMSLEECYGGYPGAWHYDWRQDTDTSCGDQSVGTVTINTMYRDNVMNSQLVTYSLYLTNRGYDGSYWVNLTPDKYKRTINVYQCPHTPTALLRKGNGTSSTFIAISDMDDDRLTGYDYYLVFGYTDRYGVDHRLSETKQTLGNTRFGIFDKAEYNVSSNRFWVYSLWRYNDGAYITSGRCYENGGVDEKWDGSAYTQSEISSRAVEDTADGIVTIAVDDENTGADPVYDMMGRRVKTISRGMYIVNGKKVIMK